MQAAPSSLQEPSSRAGVDGDRPQWSRLDNWLPLLILTILALIFLAPLLFMLVTSLRSQNEITRGVISWIPQPPTAENYQQILNDPQNPIGRWFLNSLFVSLAGTALAMVVASLAAYGLSRLSFPGRDVLFLILLSSMLIPGILVVIPLYNEFANALPNYSLIDTYWPLILPYSSSVFGVFLLRQFYLAVPKELEEAAMIDGAGKLRRWFGLIVPLTVSPTITLGILTFMGIYNDYLGPLLFTTSTNMRTITVGVALVTLGSYVSNYGGLMAFSTIAAIPVIILFLVLQRYFIGSSTLSGVKG